EITPDRVASAINKDQADFSDFLALLSPAAQDYLEPMARQAHAISLRRFGRVILMYAPIYLSNECSNACVYCGFKATRDIPRISLNMEEILAEADQLKRWGFGHALLVSGEAPKVLPVARLAEILQALQPDFPSLSLEVYPLSGPGYAQMAEAGADGLTLYQETYDRNVYAKMHPRGKKKDFNWRLDAVERAGQVGMRRLGIGSLLGLNDWRAEAIALALHADYLMKKYWRTQVSISFPRLRNIPENFSIPSLVSDVEMVQMMLALRIFLHDAGIVVSTREPAELRDQLIPLGVTQMSAGSRTEPGGYIHPERRGEQFAVVDERSPAEVARAIQKAGYEPVWKDWDRLMHEGYSHEDHSQWNAQGSGS
ncbi:2-iminoacetate synthase ThiH, partial [bacterium]|nr:2-iminoacetate synthase ThiH [bacterium]